MVLGINYNKKALFWLRLFGLMLCWSQATFSILNDVRKMLVPWLVWLSGVRTRLQTKGRDTCLGCRPGPSWGYATGNQWCFLPSLPFSLKINK